MPHPGLFAYKTDPHYAGAAALDWFDPDPNADEISAELWSGPIEPGWTHAAGFTDDAGSACVLKYNRDIRVLGIDRVRPDGSGLDPCHNQPCDAGEDQWDLIAGLQVDDKRSQRLYAYHRQSGFCRTIDVASDNEPAVRFGDRIAIGKEWSQLCGAVHDGKSCLIGYAAGDGSVAIIDPVTSDDQGMKGFWDAGWTLLTVLAQPHTGVFLYGADTGNWELRSLSTSPAGHLGSGVWRTGWSVILPFTLNETGHMLGYEARTGDVEILRLGKEGNRQNAEVIWRFRWSPGWTIQIPLLWRS